MKDWNAQEYQAHLAGTLPVLVEFHAPWCVYCRRLTPALDKVAAKNAGRLIVGKVNIDDEPELANREQIEVVPTLVLYHGGEALGSIVAPDSRARIDEFLEDFLGG